MPAPLELARRIRNRLRSKATRLRYRRGWQTLPIRSAAMRADFRHPIDSANKATLLELYRSQFADAAAAEVTAAQKLLDHEFHLLGHATRHGDRISWSLDPVSGKEWSRAFSLDVPYRGDARLGDIKLPWELNKHQYFFTLGKATWLTGDERYAREIVRQIDHWIATNPCHSGIHWISALESGTRVVSWILAYPFFAEYCEPAFLQRMLRSMAQHLLFVEHNLSLDRFPNTHLAGEAAILAIGALFVDCRHSQRWLELGLHHLETQMQQQVRTDAVHAEQSVAYHRFFLDQYYLADAMLRINGRSFSRATLHRMERMTQFLMDMLQPDGSVPNFGDCDDARGIWCRDDCPGDYRSLLALGALNFGREDFKFVAGAATEELIWLRGTQALQEFAALPSRKPDHDSIAYADAGYYVMRSGWERDASMLVFDCGPLGHGPAGHGHADALSFQLCAQGSRLCVDSGTYSYNLDYELRNRFRSTGAHNTVEIDGQDQSTIRDRMSWTTAAQARCHRWLSTEWFDLVDGEHDGYSRLEEPVTHRRVVIFLRPGVWVICDQVHGAGEHTLAFPLHLHPNCRVEQSADVVHMHTPLNGYFKLETTASVGIEQAWYSETYATKVMAPCVRLRAAIQDHGVIITRITTGEAAVSASLESGTLSIQLARPGQPPESFAYRLDGSEDEQAANELEYHRGTTVHSYKTTKTTS